MTTLDVGDALLPCRCCDLSYGKLCVQISSGRITLYGWPTGRRYWIDYNIEAEMWASVRSLKAALATATDPLKAAKAWYDAE